MNVHLISAVLGKAVGLVVTGVDARVAVHAFRFVPLDAALEGVQLMPRAVGHRAHGEVLARAAERAAAVALEVRKVDQEIGVVDQSRHIDVMERLIIDFFCIEILAEIAAVVQHGASERGSGIAAHFGLRL